MNPLTHKKTFADVKVDEKVYVLDPKDQVIREVTVTQSAPHPKSNNRHVWVIQCYMPFRINIKDDQLKEAAKFGTTVTNTFFVPRKETLVLLMSKIPTVMATESKYITEWMGKNPLGLILPKGM
jgi:hypothetical protein